MDAVAGPGFQQVLASVRKSGLVISYGILSSSQITLDVMPLLRQARLLALGVVQLPRLQREFASCSVCQSSWQGRAG